MEIDYYTCPVCGRQLEHHPKDGMLWCPVHRTVPVEDAVVTDEVEVHPHA